MLSFPRPEIAPEVRRGVAVTPEGRRLSYAECGSGPDVLLVHGTLMTADDMVLGPMPALTREFHAVAVDRPGHGGSDHVRGADASLWGQADTIRGAVRAMGLRRPIVCGHSFGGAVALAYGMAYPDEVAGVVAIAPICFPEMRLEHVLFGPRAVPVLGDLLSRRMAAPFDTALLPLLWRAMFLPQAMPERFTAAFPFTQAGRPEQTVADGENPLALVTGLARSAIGYASCRVPARILCGGADIVVNSFTQGRAAAMLIPGARLDVVPGVGHMLHHVRPDRVVDAVRAIAGR